MDKEKETIQNDNEFRPLGDYLIPDPAMKYGEWFNRGMGLRERLIIAFRLAEVFDKMEDGNFFRGDPEKDIQVCFGGKVEVRLPDADFSPETIRSEYLAPEIASGMRLPDTLSNDYTLALIISGLLGCDHVKPFFDEDDDEPVIVDDSLPWAHAIVTGRLLKLLDRSLVDGEKDRMARPSAREFMDALTEAGCNTIKCPHCGAWYYQGGLDCPWCHEKPEHPAKLDFFDILINGNEIKISEPPFDTQECHFAGTVVIRDKKCRVPRLFTTFGRSCDISGDDQYHFDIIADTYGNYLQNRYNKRGIFLVKSYKIAGLPEMIRAGAFDFQNSGLCDQEFIKLDSGDMILFGADISMKLGDKDYRFIRAARFAEGRN